MSKYVEMLEAIKDMFDHPEIKVDCGRFVPRKLAIELLDQVPIKSTDTIAVMNSPELVVYLLERGVKASNITLTLHEMCDNMKHIVENCIGVSCERMEKRMKFDVVIGNPPYNKDKNIGQSIWQDFALAGLSMTVDNGYLSMIHPPRWRGTNNVKQKSIKELIIALKSIDILWLSMHNIDEGQKHFGASTRFDMYVAKNAKNKNIVTNVTGDDKKKFSMNIKQTPIVPNNESKIFHSILCKDNEEPVNWVHSYSKYMAYKEWMIKEETSFPCIYSISKRDGSLNLRYSKEEKRDEKGNIEHFGIPKVCFGISQSSGIPFVDIEGKYGMTQFIMGITDKPEVLPLIAKAMDSPRFREMMKSVQFTTEEWNAHIIKLFRKDFWKEFVDEKGTLL